MIKGEVVLTRYDWGLIFFLLFLSLFAFVGSSYFAQSWGEEPPQLIIFLKGKESRYFLRENQELKVGGCFFEIFSGKVRVKRSTCPKKICVSQGWVDEPGESIICLPHQIVLRISGQKEAAKIDTISR